jgi:glycosyltransferase involved in cell wall biosynthesis
MPVYNGQVDFERALGSLVRDGARFELFVVDDGSQPPIRVPDGLPFEVVLIRLDRNVGITRALNTGLERIVHAGYTYVARMDADDWTLPGRFAAQMAFLDRHPDHAVVGTQAEWVDREGRLLYRRARPLDHASLVRYMHYRTGLIHASTMIRVAALVEAGFYDTGYPAAEDYELWLRLARRHKVANLPEIYYRVQISAASITGTRWRPTLSRLRLRLKYFRPTSIHAYLSILHSMALLLVPRSLVLRLYRAQSAATAPGA